MARPTGSLTAVYLAATSAARLRQKEVLELRVKDLDLERGAITVRQGKDDKDCLMRRLTAHQPLRAA